ncbi:unnamed protein product [Soboliphyme baturini]|uniref:Phosphoacetylglucosamine mutase n=1 Tax=Soboliphyme baturini TaxID=241478 RepID=A0A183IS59_9BILA|nr:unnamed protein product [Soboliphyme baturini]
MITASHNPEEDNGVKIIEPNGEMLCQSWEEHASQVINAKLENSLLCGVQVAAGKLVRYGKLKILEIIMINFLGLLTTPQLHYLVFRYNNGTPIVTEQSYYENLVDAFVRLNISNAQAHYVPKVHLDCANGVGGQKLRWLTNALEKSGTGLTIVPVNTELTCLNLKVILIIFILANELEKWASLDGDADRLVYYYLDLSNVTSIHCFVDQQFRLLDGDKIAALFAKYIKELLDTSKVDLKLGVVQTAYANGASTKFIEDVLQVTVICTYTGVKFLHKAAKELDIGIYFEANGHGTVSNRATFMQTNSRATGDAISDLLLVESILRIFDYSMVEWDGLYVDMPSRQLKVQVFAVSTTVRKVLTRSLVIIVLNYQIRLRLFI